MTYQEICRALHGEQMKKEAGMKKEALMPIGRLNKQFILPFLKSTAGMKTRLGVRFSQLPNIGYSIADNVLAGKGFDKLTESALKNQFKMLTALLQHSGAKKRLKNLTGNPKYRPLQRLFDRADVDFRGLRRPMNDYGEIYNQLLAGAKLKRDLIRRSGIPGSQLNLLESAAKKHISNLNQRFAAKEALRQVGTNVSTTPSLWERLLDLFR